LVFAASPLST